MIKHFVPTNMKKEKPKYGEVFSFETTGGWKSIAECLRCGSAVAFPSNMSHKYKEGEIATNILLHNKWHAQQNLGSAVLSKNKDPERVYEIREKIIDAYKKGITVKGVGLRSLQRYIGAAHPQTVKYHVDQLRKRGLLAKKALKPLSKKKSK